MSLQVEHVEPTASGTKSDRRPDFRFTQDGVPHLVEVKHRLPAARELRDLVLRMAYVLARHPESGAYLVLVQPSMSSHRVDQLMGELRTVLLPDIADRLQLVLLEQGDARELGELPRKLRNALAEHIDQSEPSAERLPRPDYLTEVLKLLLIRRVRQLGPATTRWLCETIGCSYPTARRALDRLAPVLTRHSDRRVELARFPKEPWTELVAGGARLRASIRFEDRSGQPRSPQSLLRRLDQRAWKHVAVGGTVGAQLSCPELDIVGVPRLDLCVHAPGDTLDLGFVEELDPALVRTDDPTAPARVVVHPIRRHLPLFEPRRDGVPRADEVECLLDLYEARLGAQADQLLEHLERSATP